MTPFTMQQNAQNNVVVVKTDGYDYEGSTGNYMLLVMPFISISFFMEVLLSNSNKQVYNIFKEKRERDRPPTKSGRYPASSTNCPLLARTHGFRHTNRIILHAQNSPVLS